MVPLRLGVMELLLLVGGSSGMVVHWRRRHSRLSNRRVAEVVVHLVVGSVAHVNVVANVKSLGAARLSVNWHRWLLISSSYSR